MPVIPATQEAEVEELLEPRRWKLHLPEIAPLHRLRLCLKEREREKKKKNKNRLLVHIRGQEGWGPKL